MKGDVFLEDGLLWVSTVLFLFDLLKISAHDDGVLAPSMGLLWSGFWVVLLLLV